MSQLIASLPDGIPLHEGDQLDLHAVLHHGVIQVTRVIRRSAAASDGPVPRPRLGDWGRKWAGTVKTAEGRTRDDLRSEYYRGKYGV